MNEITVDYIAASNTGRFTRESGPEPRVWSRLSAYLQSSGTQIHISKDRLDATWPVALNVLREFSRFQRDLEFRFVPTAEAKALIDKFASDFRASRSVNAVQELDATTIRSRIEAGGWSFTKRELKPHQVEGLIKLASLKHGANFSVPGAGKTTVTLALHLLSSSSVPFLLVVAPLNAFLSWKEVIGECLQDTREDGAEQHEFVVLRPGADLSHLASTGHRLFITSYETLTRIEQAAVSFLSQNPVHLVLDESHKIKSGFGSLRGASALRVASLAARRDILTGTPMPQSPSDLQSQLDFLWPGAGLGDRISQGESPRLVLGDRYIRTTKSDLNLPGRTPTFINVPMNPAHTALYGVVRSELLRQASELRRNAGEILQARRSVIRLLQISANPASALRAMVGAHQTAEERALYAAVFKEGPSSKVLSAEHLAREFAKDGRKSLIWSIFTDTIEDLALRLADLNPVVIRGGVPSGDSEDWDSREGRIERFRSDPNCWVMIANPAAASEGMSVHMQCHDAIYVDRSFNAVHYLQSIDRIHRLGLPLDVQTRIHILRNSVPEGLGSIDMSVARRLAAKIRALDELLDDPDLRQLALDEEESGDTTDYGIDVADIDDLIREIEGKQEPVDDALL